MSSNDPNLMRDAMLGRMNAADGRRYPMADRIDPAKVTKAGSPAWGERGDFVTPPLSPSPDLAYEALKAVEDAMLQGGDGVTGDFGWSITKLNRARPLIRAALTAARSHGGM